jgi:putative ABC transport system substrate-binding protein
MPGGRGLSVNESIGRIDEAARREHAEALLVFSGGRIFSNSGAIALFASQARLPSNSGWRDYVEVGGRMSYGPSLAENFRGATSYVDRILRGAKPTDLPAEQANALELPVNLKSAQALGITIPQSILLRADEVIR